MSEITFDDFQKIDIRIGTVVRAVVPEWSHWVIKLEVDFGEKIGKKNIFAGMMKFYETKDFEGKQFAFVVNMKPKKIGPEGDYSEGMMLAVDLSQDPEDEESKPVLLHVAEKVPSGSKVR